MEEIKPFEAFMRKMRIPIKTKIEAINFDKKIIKLHQCPKVELLYILPQYLILTF